MNDDLTVRYEEIIRLREELEKLLAHSKQPSARKESKSRKTPNSSRN